MWASALVLVDAVPWWVRGLVKESRSSPLPPLLLFHFPTADRGLVAALSSVAVLIVSRNAGDDSLGVAYFQFRVICRQLTVKYISCRVRHRPDIT